MNAEHINPFIQGSQMILNMVCNENPGLGKLFVKSFPYKCGAVSISIQIRGDVSGDVIYSMEQETACAVASRMMFGMPVPELDDMSRSALSELANMISGNVATIFSGKGVIVDISPPTFHQNAVSGDFAFIKSDSKAVCIPLIFQDGGIFEVDILIQ